MRSIFDENVLIVANDLSRVSRGEGAHCPEASDDCRLVCAERLSDAVARGRVVLDEGAEFFDKYMRHCSLEGQPGVGDAFLRAVYERGYSDWATRVPIRDADGDLQIPDEIATSTFDQDDFIWLAGTINCTEPSCVVNAVDSDYQIHQALLERFDIRVDELCVGH